MKKGLLLLLVVVLIAGHAFADFSGNARIVFAADLNKKEFGFNDVATGNYTFDFTYDTPCLQERMPMRRICGQRMPK